MTQFKIILWVFIMSVVLVCCSRCTLASDDFDTYFKLGLGILNGKPSNEIKSASIRDEWKLTEHLWQAAEAGGWSDTNRSGHVGAERLPAVHAEYQIGVKPQSEHWFVSAFSGMGMMMPPDSQLGGAFQFFHDLCTGFHDGYSSVGICYKHISSAGLEKPNKGRDFLLIQMGIVNW